MPPYTRHEEVADLGTTCGRAGTLGGLRRINDVFGHVSSSQSGIGPNAWLYPPSSCYKQTRV